VTTKADILQAIRRKCLDCSCDQPSEVRECPVTACDLWPFRFGHDPAPSRTRGFAKHPLTSGGLVNSSRARQQDSLHHISPEKSPASTNDSEAQSQSSMRTALWS
jgi:hypothetical protein